MHIRDEKALVRQRIKERAAHLSAKDRDAESRSICRRILEHLPPAPLTVCAYMPMPSEADIAPLLTDLLERGDRVFLPRFTRTHFEFRRIASVDDLVPGRFNLPEPPTSADALNIGDVSVVLVPAVAFDRHGHRLGRGNGGYDLWLSQLRKTNPAALVWGIALEHQIATHVPTEPHDQTVDAVITAREYIICS